MIRRIFLWALIAWCFVTAVIFVLAAVLPRWPRSLELPWSDFEDFVVTPDGKVAVYAAYFQQLLLYDLEGHFLASLPGPRARGSHRLAVGADGRLYIGKGDVVYVATALEPESFTLRVFRSPIPRAKGWRLEHGGNPGVISDGTSAEPVPDRAILPGETLFSGELEQRRHGFAISSGGWVERSGDRLVIHDSEGDNVALGTPWYLYWLKIPFPGLVPWLAALAYAAVEGRWLVRRGGRVPTRAC